MSVALQLNFSQTFEGTIWSIQEVPQRNLLILEVRNEDKREVRFSALDFTLNFFHWKDIIFDEAWWIGITAATPSVLLLHLYQNTENPDEKSLLAFDIDEQRLRWQQNHFVFSHLQGDRVIGTFTKPEIVDGVVDLETGNLVLDNDNKITEIENISPVKPFQYHEGHAYFDTVKSFLASKMNLEPVTCVEYLEHNSLIFISYYVQEQGLANYLIVFDTDGTMVLQEKLGSQLKGIGLETFFILGGCLFFVRNRGELVSFRIV